ncbi:MAG: nitroreductase/quinone reductase family protein, partial [Chloroflexota bacterium]
YGARVSRGVPGPLMKAGQALVSRLMRLRGIRVARLTTVGARTGQERTTDLIALHDASNTWIVVASYAGSANHPAWYFNMARNPDRVWLDDGHGRVRVTADTLSGGEREEAYAKLLRIWKGYAGYQQKTDREIPVVRLTAMD